jgi:hypothetical protein
MFINLLIENPLLVVGTGVIGYFLLLVISHFTSSHPQLLKVRPNLLYIFNHAKISSKYVCNNRKVTHLKTL